MKQLIAFGFMGLGVTLLILSLLLPSLLRRQQPLSPADYDRLEELDNKVVDIHLEMEAFKRKSGEAVSAEMLAAFDKLVADRDALNAQLEGNVDRPQWVGPLLRYPAIFLLLVGVAATLFNNRNAS